LATVAEGISSQFRNTERTYGHPIDELTREIAESGLTKHTDIAAMLRKRYGTAHGGELRS
jgi:hypothetical protein